MEVRIVTSTAFMKKLWEWRYDLYKFHFKAVRVGDMTSTTLIGFIVKVGVGGITSTCFVLWE